MKNFQLFIGMAIFLVLTSFSYAQKDTLTILHVNDTHSCLTATAPRDESLKGKIGGIARAASVIGYNKMTEPNVLTLHAGDVFIGDIFFNVFYGAAEFQIMNSLGFDAMTLGNHEFDLMPSTLESALQNSFAPEDGFPLLSANFVLEEDTLQSLKSYVKPYIIKEIGNLKVGIFGLTTPETNLLSFPAPVVFDTNIVPIAAEIVETLMSNECDIIICLSHLGFELDKVLSSYIPYIDIIVGGHDHYKTEQPFMIQQETGKTTYIVQADAFYSNLGKMKLEISEGVVSLLNYELIPLDENVPEDETVSSIISDLTSQVEAVYGNVFTQQIGSAEAKFEEIAEPIKNGYSDTPVGNLVTDAFREKTGTDIAIEPGGSTAQPLNEGPIVAADIFRMVGYGFNTVNGLGYRLVTFKMSGLDIVTGLEFGLSNIELNDEFLIQVSGMSYGFDLNKNPYERITYILVGNDPIDLAKQYSVTTNEFVLGFLQIFLGINVSDIFLYEDLSEFQVLTDYVISKGSISPTNGNRITDLNENADRILKDKFELIQNYPNPFNPTTTIEYSVPVSSNNSLVQLKVYDILGNEITTLVNESQKPGNYKAVFNAANLASGIYFYKLSCGNFTEIKKAVLLK